VISSQLVTIELSTPVPLLRELAGGGVRSTSTETHNPHTSTPAPPPHMDSSPDPGIIKSLLWLKFFSLFTNSTR